MLSGGGNVRGASMNYARPTEVINFQQKSLMTSSMYNRHYSSTNTLQSTNKKHHTDYHHTYNAGTPSGQMEDCYTSNNMYSANPASMQYPNPRAMQSSLNASGMRMYMQQGHVMGGHALGDGQAGMMQYNVDHTNSHQQHFWGRCFRSSILYLFTKLMVLFLCVFIY